MNVKVCELVRVQKINGAKQLVLKPADPVAPFLIFLYCSYGTMVARSRGSSLLLRLPTEGSCPLLLKMQLGVIQGS